MIPARVALALQEDGWTLRNDIIWHKPNYMPSSVKDRLSSTYEHLFHLVKSKKYFYDLDSIRVPHKTGPAQFNYRVRGAKKGHFGIVGVKAASEEMERHDNKGQKIRGLKIKGKVQLGQEQSHGQDVSYHTKFDEKCQAKRVSQGLAYAGRVLSREHETAINHLLGKNPGDVIQLKFKEQHSIRQDPNLGGAVGLAEFREWCRANNLPEAHFLGKNPGDVLQLPNWKQEPVRTERLLNPAKGVSLEGRNPGNAIPANTVRYRRKPHNPGDFWEINTKPFPEAHFAVYPEALCIRPILSSCPVDGLVLDPFAGSGTTMKVALELGRDAIGIELNQDYAEIIKQRVPSVIDDVNEETPGWQSLSRKGT